MESLGDYFKLKDIVEKAANSTISLPTVQRGFVWKPYQIENLWDSLLRGYPIGSFVLSSKTDSNEEYELLDGQQRATAICLGFYDPIKQTKELHSPDGKIFKTSSENIIIFIDLAKPNPENDNRKYLFRVITKSHPWGYRRQENQKILESENITKAMRSYGLEKYDYLKTPLNNFWPYDSYEPLPIALFINAAITDRNIEDLMRSIETWKEGKKLSVIEKRNDSKVNFYSISDIFMAVKSMLDNCKIPILPIDLPKLYSPDENNISIIKNHFGVAKQEEDTEASDDATNEDKDENKQNNVENRSVDEIENLFIRLNSGGTPLRGEELNYSVLKAHIKSELQKEIEERCKGIFYPARFITIAFRLFNNLDKQSTTEKDSISMKIKPKQFQRNIKEKKEAFINFITDTFIDDNNILRTKAILTYNKDSNPTGLPIFIVNTLADKAPEIMFMLLYRLIIKKDQIDPDLHAKVLGMITLFVWLGKGERQKDHSKLLNNIWPCVKNFDTKNFWSNETIQRAMLLDDTGYEILTPFPRLKDLGKIVPKEAHINIRRLTQAKICDHDYGIFTEKMFFNKDLILYAQRSALSEWFQEIEDYNLEDTNRAFDWDHIAPNNAIHRKWYINEALTNWYSSNGNFRAWPYSLNRKDQAAAPSDKLNPTAEDDIEWWSEHSNYGKKNSLKDDLLDASCCDKGWLKLTSDDIDNIKENIVAKKITYCILNRNIRICKEWYEKLHIDNLFFETPEKKDIKRLFGNIINKKMWNGEKEDDDRHAYYLSVGENNLYIYFSFNIEGNTLKEGEIYFGIACEENETLKRVKIKKEQQETYNRTAPGYIGTGFTLVSYSESSIINLFKEFNIWLNKFPDKKIGTDTIHKYGKSIKAKYKKRVLNNQTKRGGQN